MNITSKIDRVQIALVRNMRCGDSPDVTDAGRGQLTSKFGREGHPPHVLGERLVSQHGDLILPVPHREHVVRVPAHRHHQVTLVTTTMIGSLCQVCKCRIYHISSPGALLETPIDGVGGWGRPTDRECSQHQLRPRHWWRHWWRHRSQISMVNLNVIISRMKTLIWRFNDSKLQFYNVDLRCIIYKWCPKDSLSLRVCAMTTLCHYNRCRVNITAGGATSRSFNQWPHQYLHSSAHRDLRIM